MVQTNLVTVGASCLHETVFFVHCLLKNCGIPTCVHAHMRTDKLSDTDTETLLVLMHACKVLMAYPLLCFGTLQAAGAMTRPWPVH